MTSRDELSDEALIAAHCAGAPDAFSKLFQRHLGLVSRLMRRQVRVRQHADELVQETFLLAHRSARQFQSARGGFKPWLMTIALNVRRGYWRRKGRRPEVPMAGLETDVRFRSSDDANRVEAVHDARVEVDRALAVLPEGQRQVIELHWFASLSFPEIAEALGASLSAVKVRAHRGYRAMRDHLSDEMKP